MSTGLFVALVFVVLGLMVARLGQMMRASPNDPLLTIRNRYTEADPRVWADASRYLGGHLMRLGLWAALLAVVLHGLSLPEDSPLPERLALAIDGLLMLVGLCALLVYHWLHARERWEHYHTEDRWPAEDR